MKMRIIGWGGRVGRPGHYLCRIGISYVSRRGITYGANNGGEEGGDNTLQR